MGSRVELFEQIRRDREREGLSIRALAERHGVHRRAVRQALASPLPPPRKAPEGRPAPKLGPYRDLIDSWLVADGEAPPKQRHTARRVWQRLVTEHGADVAEIAVRKYVRRRRRELGQRAEAYVPQVYEPGREAEVDWGEAEVELAGRRCVVGLFIMRACYSGASFLIAFERQTQQAFLEGHVEALRFFGGVFATIRYDNLRAAVKQVLRGRRRVESDRFVALRSHYLFESVFTLVGLAGAHEKGGVEGELGRYRRAHLVPPPRVASLQELNRLLEDWCYEDLERRIAGRSETVREAFWRERAQLRELPLDDFDAREQARPLVDQKSLVTLRQSRYSVPVTYVGCRLAALIGAREVEIKDGYRMVARHARLYARFQVSARLDHYLELLRRKPGALKSSLPLYQERARGSWPACYDQLWQGIERRYGASEAARQMVDVLLLCRELEPTRVERAVQAALAAGALDGRAVALLARGEERAPAPPLTGIEPQLAALEQAPPTLEPYDALLAGRRP